MNAASTSAVARALFPNNQASWQHWWEHNKDPYLRLKERVHGPGVDVQGAPSESMAPTEEQRLDLVLPALLRLAQKYPSGDVQSACMVAMAKIGEIHEEIDPLEVFRANLKRGRGDKRGAFVMAGYLFVVLLAQWVLQIHHVKSFAELGMFAYALQSGLLVGASVWVIYVALEPYARRQWPQAMITWSRLLTGRFRDPLIGRDLLIGSLTGVAVSLLLLFGGLIPGWLGQPGPDPITNSVGTLGGLSDVAGIMLGLQPGAMIAPIAIFFLIFGVRLVVRKQWIAISFAFVLMSLVQGLQSQQTTVLGWVASPPCGPF